MTTTAFAAVGATVLAVSLRIEPGSDLFVVSTLVLASVWALGAFFAGPLHLGRIGPQLGAFAEGRRPILTSLAIGGLLAGVFVLGSLVVREIEPLRVAFGLTGAAVLIFLGIRTLVSAFRVRLGGEVDEEVSSPRKAFATALGATASNPLTIASWAAIFTAAGAAGAAEGAGVACSWPGSGSGA